MPGDRPSFSTVVHGGEDAPGPRRHHPIHHIVSFWFRVEECQGREEKGFPWIPEIHLLCNYLSGRTPGRDILYVKLWCPVFFCICFFFPPHQQLTPFLTIIDTYSFRLKICNNLTYFEIKATGFVSVLLICGCAISCLHFHFLLHKTAEWLPLLFCL